MKWELYQCGKERGDCTTPYRVRIIEGGTVKDFIETVLKNKKEWGYIGIFDKTVEFQIMAVFGNPYMEYRHGETIDRENLKDVENKKVINARADGGYSRMDYLLEVE